MKFWRNTKMVVKALIERGFRRWTVKLSRGERDGLRRAGRMIINHRVLLSVLVITGLVAAVLEGGTLGILGLAISVLLEEEILLTGYFPGSIGAYVDTFLYSISAGGLFLLLVGFAVAAQIFKSVILYLSFVVQIYLTAELRRDIQRLGTRHVMEMSYAQVSMYPAGTVATLIDQSEVIENLVTQIGNVCRAVLMMMAYVAILLWMSVSTVLVILVLVLIFWFSMNSTVRQLRRLSADATQGQIDLWRSSIEYLNSPKLLRIFNGTKIAEEVINEARDRQIFPERKADVIESAIGPAIEVLTIFSAGLFLIVGYLLGGEEAKAAVPTLFVYVIVFYRLKPIIKVFTDVRTKMARILPPLERVANFLRREGKEFSRTDGKVFSGLKNEIRLNDVSFNYMGSDITIVKNVSFSIKMGQTVAMVGESGAGKTTLADLMMGLYEPTTGEIFVDDTPLNELRLSDWRDHIGVVDQETFLLNASVRDNIEFSRPNTTFEEVSAAARAAHAEDFILKLDCGYDTVIGDRGFKLSGGQRQRVALARALVRNPEILILDEATSALDTESERAIQEALDEMHNTRTILVIAHRLSTVANADHIVVLGDGGMVLEEGAKDELLSRNGQFAKLWNIQVGSIA